ncbi:condensin complex subunit 1-like [Saccostrea echinata]|uniref:condensin complex subunit 1-like n=1 Tax=Saccostrea echinata TaxID=191078 RepID=UPI002A80219A|nr:condensin complex subunit 1-like [Saccostrea echinata]
MNFEFIIPSTKDDLLNKTQINQYVVDEVLSFREIPGSLQALKSSFRVNGAKCLLENFDVFFSILCLRKDVQPDLKEDAWQLLLKVAKSLATEVASVLEDTSLEPGSRLSHLNQVKMLCYLLCQFMEMFEDDSKEKSDVITTGKGRKNKKSTDMAIDWEVERENGVKALLHLVSLNILRLWDPPIAEAEFVNMVTNLVYKLLENPAVVYVKAKETRTAIFNIVGVMVKRYNHGLSASLKILQQLQHFEHLVSPLAEMTSIITTDYGNKSMVAEIMREIGRKDPKDLVRDNTGTKSFATFLVELSEKVPGVMMSYISVVLCHLEGESYTMRNGVLGVMGEILLKVLSKDDLEDKLKDTRDQFLEKLEEHIHDVNAFVRSRVLQICLTLVNEKCLPLPRHEHLLGLCIGRLKDKSSQVRKQAIQLVTAFIKSNPFAAKLSLEELKANYEKEKEKLDSMAPEEQTSVLEDSAMVKIDEEWKPLEKKLKRAMKKAEEEEDENMEEGNSEDLIQDEETANSVMDRIYNLLTEEKFTEAKSLLGAFKDAFPDNSFMQEMAKESQSEADGEDSQGSTGISTDVGYLKMIFYGHKKQTLAISSGLEEEKEKEKDPIVNEVSKQQVLVQYLKDCCAFATQIQASVPVICQLLGSKTITDILEAIDFFVTGFEFGVTLTMMGIRRMLHLIWSREASVKDAVVAAYKRLYLNPQVGNQRSKAFSVVKNLSALLSGANLGDLTSLEGLMVELMKSGEIDQGVIQMLWERFAMKVPNTTVEDSRAAVTLLYMIAGADMGVVNSNIDVLVKEGLGERADSDFILARDTCLALLKLGPPKKVQGQLQAEPFRFPQNHDMFDRIQTLLINGVQQLDNPYWIPFAEQAINVIYKLAEHPDIICGDIIKALAKEVIKAEKQNQTLSQVNIMEEDEPMESQPEKEPDSQSKEPESQGSDASSQPSSQEGGPPSSPPSSSATVILTRLISVAGHVAFRQMVHLDTYVFGELKRRRAIQEQKKDVKTPKADRRGSKVDKTTASEAIEDELGLAGAAEEDADAEYIRKVCDVEIVSGDSLLGCIGPLLVTVCTNQSRYSDPNLRTAATLSLAKFMLVSSDFCENNLQLLFTVLEKSPYPTIRANTIIALGDLTVRFPNLIEPWTPHMYARLRDDSQTVRKNTLQVLTHLILNDMVKVKGQISEVATCVVDHDERISSLAKLFFHELSHKGNAIYNIMPDVISRLSDPDVGVDEENFRIIMKYLFSFIQKDRQCESLVEKLCHRFRATKTDRQWRDLSFCLSMMSYSEKSIRKLQENFACFGDKLADEEVYSCFCTIISKSRSFAKPTAKTLIDELEQRLQQCHTKGLEEGDIAVKASQASQAASLAKGKSKTKGAKTPAKGKTPARGRRGGRRQIDSDSDGDFVDGDENTTPPKRQTKRKSTRQKPKVSFDSDSDSEIELFDLDKSSQGTQGTTTGDGEESDDSDIIPTKRTGRRVLNSPRRIVPLQDLNGDV